MIGFGKRTTTPKSGVGSGSGGGGAAITSIAATATATATATVSSAFQREYEEKRSVCPSYCHNTDANKTTNAKNNHYDNTNNDGDDGDDGSLTSSLSFYDDFPQLYFAVRNGRFAKNSVFLSWDSARRHIVDYPDAEYIATPTLKQAHSYTTGIGNAFQPQPQQHKTQGTTQTKSKNSTNIYCSRNDGDGDSYCKQSPSPLSALSSTPTKSSLSRVVPERLPSRGHRKKDKQHSYTTRRLVLEYYELYDPRCKTAAKGKDKDKNSDKEQQQQQLPLTIRKFLKERNMFKSKFKVFAKHWQRSGLLMMSNDEKPLEDAIVKYDAWIRNRKLEKFGGTDEHDKRGINNMGIENGMDSSIGKRKRPTTFQDGTAGGGRNQHRPGSTKKQKTSNNSLVTPSPKPKPKTKSKKAAAKHPNANANAAFRPNHVISASILQTATIAEHHAEYNNTTNSNGACNSDEEDDNDERWNGMYERLKAFHSEHGHCKVPKSKNPDLAYWTSYTRRRMKLEATRSGARALSLREEKLLNDLDFDPVYKEIVTEFNKYLGMRVAKLFDVWDDFGNNSNDNDNDNDNGNGNDNDNDNDIENDIENDNDNASTSSPSSSVPISNFKDMKQHKDEIRDGIPNVKKQTPRITTKPFFGTVGRISSVCNRVRNDVDLRMEYIK
jgi:hypothetical protein